MKTDRDGYPTTCTHCNKPIVKSKGSSQHHYDHATKTATSWHTHCAPKKETP